jgi:hypothetical protein
MFLGHFGVGMGTKPAAPRLSLGTLILAAQFLDLVWPIFVLAGLEHVRIAPGITRMQPLDFYDYPISHSLLGACGWALVVGGAHFARKRRVRDALILGALVISHWVLDFISHRPDMPIGPTGPYVGLGLWGSVPATLAAEFGILLVGSVLYVRSVGKLRLRFLIFVLFLAAAYIASLVGPPPPSGKIVALSALLMWPVVGWAYWIDRSSAAAR